MLRKCNRWVESKYITCIHGNITMRYFMSIKRKKERKKTNAVKDAGRKNLYTLLEKN
jgi:hypothetical protein